jgi:hypothetical protein
VALKCASHQHIVAHYIDAQPFVWTRTAGEMLASVAGITFRTLAAQSSNL